MSFELLSPIFNKPFCLSSLNTLLKASCSKNVARQYAIFTTLGVDESLTLLKEIPNLQEDYPIWFKKELSFLKNNLEQATFEIFSCKHKKYKKILAQILNQELVGFTRSIIHLNNTQVLSEMDFNLDLIFNYLSLAVDSSINPQLLKKNQIQILAKNLPQKRVIELVLRASDHEFLPDIILAIKSAKRHSIPTADLFPKKPKNFKSIHDFMIERINEAKKFKVANYPLNPREDFLALDKKQIEIDGKQLTVVVPKTRHELVLFGSKKFFDNCVGTFEAYANNMKEGKSTILGIFEGEKPMYCIHTEKYSFKEAKGVSNSQIPKDIYKKLTEFLTQVPQLPTDFLSIGWQHHFIRGYKYNPENNTFYLMFAQGAIYEYENFDNQTYEDFAKDPRKGSFLNSVIKRKFHGTRIV